MAYIGDDINDLACISLLNEVGGLTGCPADAVADVSMVCDFVSETKEEKERYGSSLNGSFALTS